MEWGPPDDIIILGDFVDNYPLSRWPKNPRAYRFLDRTLDAANLRLDELDLLGATRKVFVKGNHEGWFDNYLRDNAPAFEGLISLEDWLRLEERGYEVTPYKKHTRYGKLFITHDVGKVGRTAPFGVMDTFQHSVITGHTHRIGYVVEANAAGETLLSATFGWGGDVDKVEYLDRIKAIKTFVHGFGISYLDTKTGIVYATPVPVVKNKVMIEGVLYG